MRVLGIDPGIQGASAVFDDESGMIDIQDIPLIDVRRGKTKRSDINGAHWYSWMLTRGPYDFAVLEDVSSMPEQGIASSFRFGHAKGLAHGLIVSLHCPHALVRPNIWKRDMQLGRDKDEARQIVTRMFPKSASLFTRKKDANRAEALLLAVWGSREIAKHRGAA